MYPSAPAYIENPKMLVMPYGHGGVRRFTGCGPANEIRGTGNTSFSTPPTALARDAPPPSRGPRPLP